MRLQLKLGVAVKAQELAERVRKLQLLSKRIQRYQDPVQQCRLKTHPRNPSWSKSCSRNQVDDAKILLGIHYHGYGNWENIRTKSMLCLTGKIALDGLSNSENFYLVLRTWTLRPLPFYRRNLSLRRLNQLQCFNQLIR